MRLWMLATLTVATTAWNASPQHVSCGSRHHSPRLCAVVAEATPAWVDLTEDAK